MSGETNEEEMRAAPRGIFVGEASPGPAARSEGATGAADTLPMVWVNGQRMASGAMHISALDRGFTLADGVAYVANRAEDLVLTRAEKERLFEELDRKSVV